MMVSESPKTTPMCRKGSTCNCLDEVNNLLRPENYRVGFSVSLAGGDTRVVLDVSKIEPRKGRKPPVLVATFCPFCGKEYR